jgi:PIN domain nuclease of toxin-antitoxin system
VSYLFDTHMLLWAAGMPEKLHPRVSAMIDDGGADRCLSVASLWEAAIKHARRKPDFQVEVEALRGVFIANGFRELNVSADHIFALRGLPALHGDPFDRLLVAQAIAEDLILVTADKGLAAYPARVMVV